MNAVAFQFVQIMGTNQNSIFNALVFMGVVALHGLGLLWVARQLPVSFPVAPALSVMGTLVAPEPQKNAQQLQAESTAQSSVPVKPATQPVNKPIDRHLSEKTSSTSKFKQETPPQTEPETAKSSESSPALPSTPSETATFAAPAQNTQPAQETSLPIVPPRTDAAHLNNPRPAYPALSRRLGEEGKVLLDVYILANGNVGEVKLNTTSGFSRLDNAALQAVRTWKFLPATQGAKPIAYWYLQPVSFNLNN